ncbi:MAG: hypothetical protein WDO73_27590 [Ignavibacteriota bacterium]
MIQPLDVTILLIIALVQWRVTVLLLRPLRRDSAWRYAVLSLNVLVAVGWLLKLIPAIGGPVAPGSLALVMRSAVLAYGMAATAMLALYALFHPLRKKAAADFSPGRRRLLNAAGNLAMMTPAVALAYGALIERLDFRVREVDVPIPGLPDDLDGLRILHLSDIHLSLF